MYGASTTSQGNLSQHFTVLIVDTSFLIASLSLPSIILKSLLLVLWQEILLKGLASSFLQATFKSWKAAVFSAGAGARAC